jgi:diguanylate cyclase (GGDEF)-like protein
MNLFLFEGKNSYSTEDLHDLARELNINRIVYVAVILLVFQIINFFLPSFYSTPGLILGTVTILFLALASIALIKLFYAQIVASIKVSRMFFMTFGVLMFIGMQPFFIADILYTGLPINAILFCFLLTIAPVNTKREMVLVFLIFIFVNLLLSFHFNASTKYILMFLCVSGTGLALSLLIQGQYMDIILKLKQETRTDPLTQILNRKGGLEKIQILLEICKRHNEMVALYMADIDYFKNINDSMGHLQGDAVLMQVARIVTGVFARTSDVVCRYGGEEFLICTLVSSREEAASMALKLSKSIQEQEIAIPANNISEILTLSIGYTLYTPDKTSLDKTALSLIREADEALYRAKNRGRNTVVLYANADT